MGLNQDLDWREVMSWYAVGGATYTVRGTTQQSQGALMLVGGLHLLEHHL